MHDQQRAFEIRHRRYPMELGLFGFAKAGHVTQEGIRQAPQRNGIHQYPRTLGKSLFQLKGCTAISGTTGIPGFNGDFFVVARQRERIGDFRGKARPVCQKGGYRYKR